MFRNLIDGLFGRSAPVSVNALVDEGNRLAAQGEHERAVACYDRALAHDPASAVAQNNRSLSLFALGRTKEAWVASEARFQLQEKTRRFAASPPVPRWHGERLDGRLLVLWEQGLGDVLQHLRFLPVAAVRTGGLAFLCPAPLAGLVAHSFPGIEVLVAKKGWSPAWRTYAAHVPLLSLPLALSRAQADVAVTVPYLAPDVARASRWREVLAPVKELRAALVWAGARSYGNDRKRSIPSREVAPLLAVPGVRWYALQNGVDDEARTAFAAAGSIEYVGERLPDFAEIAAFMASLDLVVTVDTSFGNLAGALGRPLWMLLARSPDWRWGLGTDTGPWYPSARLFRQGDDAGWPPVIARVAAALDARVRSAHA